MLFEIGPYKTDVDVEKTRAYYRTAPGNACTCDGCENFAAAVSFFPREVKDFFERLGADLKKPAELTCPFSLDGGKTLNYSGSFYHLCGRLSNGVDCKTPVNKYMTHIDENVLKKFEESFCFLWDALPAERRRSDSHADRQAVNRFFREKKYDLFSDEQNGRA